MVLILLLYLYWIHNTVIYFFSNFLCSDKEYTICLISFNKYSDVLSAFICARAIGNLWSNYLGVNILNPLSFVSFVGNIPLLKALRINRWPSWAAYALLEIFLFLFLSSTFFGLDLLLKFSKPSNKLLWSISASSILIYHYKYYHQKILSFHIVENDIYIYLFYILNLFV